MKKFQCDLKDASGIRTEYRKVYEAESQDEALKKYLANLEKNEGFFSNRIESFKKKGNIIIAEIEVANQN
jgi:hypothetical protein